MGLTDIFSSGSENKHDNTSKENRYPSDWNSRRKEVYKRDDYECQNCMARGGATGDTELHAHHIVPISEGGSHDKDNLITLCKKCHDKVHNGELGIEEISESSNYLVAMEAAWLVRDVEDVDEAIEVAVSSAAKRLEETDKEYVNVEVGVTGCPSCGEPFDSAFIAADTALVGLLLEIDVFNADSARHASKVAKSELSDPLRDVPLTVIDTVELDDEEKAESK